MAANDGNIMLEVGLDTSKATSTLEELRKKIELAQSAIKYAKETKTSHLFASGGGTRETALSKYINEQKKEAVRLALAEVDAWNKVVQSQKRHTESLKEVSKEYHEVEKGVKEASEAVKKSGDEMEKTEKKEQKLILGSKTLTQVYANMTQNMGKRIATYVSYATINKTISSFSEAIRSVSGLQTQFANIQAITASTDKTMSSLRNTILDIGNSSKYTSEELAKTTVILGQAGYSATEIEKMLESVTKLAGATGTDLNTAVNVATSSLSVWNLEATRMAHVSDVLTTAVNKTKAEIGTIANGIQYAGATLSNLGVSLEESVALFSAVTNAGLKARSVIGTGSRALVTELINPSKKLKDVLDRLNVSLEDIDISSRGVINVLQTLKEAGFSSAEAYEALDRRAASFYSAASSQLETMKFLSNAFLEAGSTAKAYETQMNTISAQATRFGNIMKTSVYETLEPFVRTLTQVLKTINNIIDNAAFRNIFKWLGQFLVINTVSSSFIKFRKHLKETIEAIGELNGVSKGNEGVFKKTTRVVSGYVTSIIAASGATNKFKVAVNGLKTAAKSLWATFKPMLIAFAAFKGFELLYDRMSGRSAEAKFEQAMNSANKTQGTIDSLRDAYDELIKKQNTYKNDTAALSNRIAQLNNQFAELNGLMLLQSDTFEQVMGKISGEVFKQEADKAYKLNKAAKVKGKDAEKIRRDASAFSTYDQVSPLELISSFITGEEINNYTNQILEWFDKVDKQLEDFTTEKVNALHEEANLIKDSKERQMKLDYLRARAEQRFNEVQAEALEASAKAGLDFTKLDVESRSKMTSIQEDFKAKYEEFMNSPTLNVEEILKLTNEKTSEIEKIGNEARERLDEVIKKNPALKKFSTILTQMVDRLLVQVNKSALEMRDSVLPELEKNTKEDFEAAKKNYKKIMQLAKSNFFSPETARAKIEESRSALSKAQSDFAQAQSANLAFQYKYNLNDPNYVREARRNQEALELERQQADSDQIKVITEVTSSLKDLHKASENLSKRLTIIKNTAEEEKLKARTALNIPQYEGMIEGLSGGDTLSGFSSYLSDELNRKKIEYNKKVLEIEKQQLNALIEEKNKSDGIVGSLQSKFNYWEKIKNSTQGNEAMVAEYNNAVEQSLKYETEINSALATQASLKKEIADKQEQITKDEFDVMMSEYRKTGKYGVNEVNPLNAMASSSYQWMKDNGFPLTADKIIDKSVYEGLNQISSGFSQFFKDISTGAKSGKEAFKDMVRNIIQSMGEFLIDLGVKAAMIAALNAMTDGILGNMMKLQTAGIDSNFIGPMLPHASGGSVRGGTPNRDSVATKLMPGEYVLKKSTASALGPQFLNKLNNNPAAALSNLGGNTILNQAEPSVTNVWVVSKEEEAGMGPNDVIVTISNDIRRGGVTKQLIQSVVAGRRM